MKTKSRKLHEMHKFSQSVIHNLDVSVIIPIYGNLDLFCKTFNKNSCYLQRNGIEVLVVLFDTMIEYKLIEYIKDYPFINWKIVIAQIEQYIGNKATVINIGIQFATKKYILTSDPEVEFQTDVIYYLRRMLSYYPKHYARGACQSSDYLDNVGEKDLFISSNNLMVERKIITEIRGFNIRFNNLENEIDNLCKILDIAGVKFLLIPEARSIFRRNEIQDNECINKATPIDIKKYKKSLFPIIENINNETITLRQENIRIVYDWQNNLFSDELCISYLSSFIKYEIKDSSIFKKQYKKVILCQAYNESEFMTGFLEDMAKYFDGIILLDDGSSDDTWVLAKHEKILLKVKKKRECFNDLENRNILLKLSSFIKSTWFCFMDIDERIDARYNDFNAFEDDTKVDVIAFNGVYMWENERTYKKDVPYANQGVLKIFRMFRSMGNCMINTYKKKLHFPASPYFNNILYSNILIKDYGSMTKDQRIKKHLMYTREDKAMDLPFGYNYLLDYQGEICDVDKLII